MQEHDILLKFKTELNIKDITSLQLGVSNNCYRLDDRYILKISYDSSFPLLDDKVLQEDAYKKGLCPRILTDFSNERYQISEYQNDLKSFPINELNNNQLQDLIKSVKIYHQLQEEKLKEISLTDLIKTYLALAPNKYEKYLPLLPKLPKCEKLVNVHLDLVQDNILFNKSGDLKLIDYDLSIKGDPLLDLTSLLSENDIDERKENYLIDLFFEGNLVAIKEFKTKLPLFTAYLDLLWYSWAEARKLSAPKEKRAIYQKIALLKDLRFDGYLKKQGLL